MKHPVSSLFFTPVNAQGAGGGPIGPIHFLGIFPLGISVRNLHRMYKHPKQPYISKKRTIKTAFFFKMAAKQKGLFVSRKKSRDQNFKNYFPNGIFK